MMKPQETGVTVDDNNSDTSASERTNNAEAKPKTFSQKWTDTVNRIRAPVLKGLHKLTDVSAKHPKSVIVSVVVLSLALFLIGLATGFSLEVDEGRLWTPGA